MSQFDPEQFLDGTVDGANATSRPPCPVGDWLATVDGTPDLKGGVSEKNGKPWARVDVRWRVENPTVTAETGLPFTTVRQGIMLDLTEGGAIDTAKGRNPALGRLREALGLNEEGHKYQVRELFQMMEGRSAIISVSHREYQGEIYDDVKKVARAT